MGPLKKGKLTITIAIFIIAGLGFLILGKTLAIMKAAGIMLLFLGGVFALAFGLSILHKKLKGGN